MIARGWEECDFVFVTGDAYVDHPSFAAALLGRLLEAEGYRVCILAQPDWKDTEAFRIFGRPRLGFLVSGGAMDSLVAHYTANKKKRSGDAYSPGGKSGYRPDRVIITYTAKIREAYKNIPIIIGGIEASMRRFAHYDYWSDTVKHSLLLDSKADLLSYGMGERSILEVARRLASGEEISRIRGVRGTCWRTGRAEELPPGCVLLPSFEEVKASKEAYARSFVIQERNTDAITASVLAEPSESRFVVQEPPALPLSQAEFDRVMELPYTRRWHPVYDEQGGIPALTEVLFSLTSSRGCFGGCSFCAIAFHQGRRIQSRSHDSLEREAACLTKHPQFRGYIHDVGGPTANFRQDACRRQKTKGACPDRQCLGNDPCAALETDHRDYLALLRRLRKMPEIKKVFIRSGIRFDYLIGDRDDTFFRELCEHHISGQLKVAPEHVSDRALALMRKSRHSVYTEFARRYAQINRELGKKQYLVPYYIASHPGAGLPEAIENALYLKKSGFVPDQVQDFYPTPGSLSTCMYYTGLDPYTMEPVYVPRGQHERSLQRALLQFNRKENHRLVREALRLAGREDLIGFGPGALAPPEPEGRTAGIRKRG
jgi:uncharacterized radical SAM protein YgiQ